MAVAGIYPASQLGSGSLHDRPVGARGPQLSDREVALLAELPDQARESKLATHAELRTALIAMAERHDHDLKIEISELGFTAKVGTLRVVANKRGTGEETFYCQGDSAELLRQLAEEIARVCGPQLLLPVDSDEDGVLIVAH